MRLDQIQIVGNFNSNARQSPNEAYSGQFAPFETQTPQYPYPNPYNNAIQGYRRNELIYACINLRANAVSEPTIHVQDVRDEENIVTLKQHKLRQLMRTPLRVYENDEVVYSLNEKEFWNATEIYLCTAGFAAWEMEFNNLGEPINLYPMRPDWCSFRRGERNPLKYIRYQPYGLPYADIPLSRVLLFQYFDPVFPLVKFLSPTAVALRSLSVDNATTDFLQIFFQRGALVNGLLKTDQTLQDAEAIRYQQLWRQQHGGAANWGENSTAVLGSGLTYQSIQMNMRDMAFPEVDARAEVKICEAFGVPSILVGAKVGQENAHLNVFAEANAAWYEKWVSPELDRLDSAVESQLLPKFEEEPESFSVSFDTSKVSALQEDKDKLHIRVRDDAKAGIISRNAALIETGREPIDVDEAGNPIDVYLNATVRAMDTGGIVDGGISSADETTQGTEDTVAPELAAAKELETKRYKDWLKRGAKQGKSFKFRWLDKGEQAALMRPKATKANSIAYGSDAHKAHMTAFEKRAQKHEAIIKAAARGLFERQKAAVVAGLGSTKSAPDPFDIDEWVKEFTDTLTPLILNAIKDAGTTAHPNFEVDNPRVTKFIKQREQRFAVKLNNDTWEQLRDAMAQNIEDGDGLDGLMESVDDIMGDKIRSSAETIARTESISALNEGTLEGWQEGGVTTKVWLAAMDDRTRETHAEMHGQEVGIDEDFESPDGATGPCPGSMGEAGEDINCRCSMTAGFE